MKRSAFAIFRTGVSNFKFQISIFLLLLFTACGSPENHDHVDADTPTFTCPMHPTVVSDKPGTCPVCGMDLVRKARPGETVEITEDLSKLLKSPGETVVASVKTVKGQYKSVPVSVDAQGIVTYDTRNIFTVPARVAGRLEKIYFKYEFQPISKGQKIAEIYSPALITAQRELIFLLENDAENNALIDAARRKLELLGMTRGQINDLLRTKQARTTISVYSPHSGYVISGKQAPAAPLVMPSGQQSGGGMSDGMAGSRSSASMTTPQQSQESSSVGARMVREGDYVASGETLFTVVNANALRIELNLPGSYTGAVKKGSKVELDLGTGHAAEARVDFIQPFFGEGQEFMKVRVYTIKTEGLHIGHLVNARIHLDARESLWIPREAVVDLGTQKVVFLKERGVLRPKKVITGITTEGMIEVTSGLASADEIAANAQYLVDSESFIRVGR